MGRGCGVSPKRNFKRGVRSKGAGSDDSDEDYVVSDEENEVSACSDEDFCSSPNGYASDASDRLEEEEEEEEVRRKVKKVGRSKKPKKSYGRYKEEEEEEDEDEDDDKDDKEDGDEDYNVEEDEETEVKTVGRLKGGQKNGVKPSQKRRRFGCNEDEDDDDEEFAPSNDEEDEDNDDDDFAEDEDDSLDEEESRVKRKKTNSKVGKRVLRKKFVRSRKRRKRSMVASKKPARKKARKAYGFRRKVRSDDDYDDFIDNGVVLREQGEVKRGLRRFVMDSDSDFAPAPSNEYEYTISEEEREQVREAEEFCRVKTDSRSSSVPEKIQVDKVLQVERKPKGRKGKEKVEEEVKTEVPKRECGICLSEEDKRRVRGTINCCEHYFCFTCISEWAKVESRCPLCKQRFKTISKRARARSSTVVDLRVVTIEVPERDQVYQPTEEELRSYLYPYEDLICSECHQGGHDDLMLLCDECDSSAHTFCVGLGHEVPEGSWFCLDCKPLDPESPNSPQTHLSDQRLANNTSTNRASVVINNAGEGFDLNSVSSQGLAALPSPRQQFGGFQATMPLAGAGASTVSGRIRLRHQIHHCLSERPDRPEGNFPSSQLEQVRETIQQESAQFLDERFCENHSPVGQGSDLRPSNNLSHHPIRGMGQNQNQNQNPNPTTILSGISNDALWPGLEERNSLLGFEQQLRQCNGGPNSCSVRQEVDFHAAKEQLQLMVKSHLKNLSRGSDLAQSKLEDIAKCSTQTILVACGLGHNDVVVLPMSPPPTCDHIEITPGKPSLVRGCCSSCFDSFVGDVVKKILDAKLSEVQQWLCLAL